MNQLNDRIESINGYNMLTFNLSPNTSVIIEPSTMIHMDGNLVVEPTLLSKNDSFFSRMANGIKRGLTGSSFFDSQISNRTSNNLKICLGSILQGGINKIDIKSNEVWRFTPSSFIACTSNLLVSGNLNIFSNLKAALGGQSILYTEISSTDGNPGTVWISSYGGCEKHELNMGEKSESLSINDGCFLGMLAEDKTKKINYWDSFVNVGSANGFLKGLLTNTALLLKIQDKKLSSTNNNVRCTVYTQTLNIRNLNNHIAFIAQQSVQHNGDIQLSFSGGNYLAKYEKYDNKYNNLTNLE
jgi:uncharacterized protein (AIM24 family)